MSLDRGWRTRIPLRVLAAIIASVLAPAQAAAHSPADHELRALLQSRVDEGGAVGIVVGLLEADGKTRVVSVGSAGEGARPLGPQTVFEIGSIAKAFTGTLLADMARREEVSLADPVARYLPDHVRVPSRAQAEITLLDLTPIAPDCRGCQPTSSPQIVPTRTWIIPPIACTRSCPASSSSGI